MGGGDLRRQETLLKIIDAATGRETASLQGHRGAVFAVGFSPDGETLATAGLDQTIRLWDFAIGREVRQLKGHTDSVWSLAFDPTGRRLATASWDTTVKVWRAEQPQDSRRFPGLPGYSVAFSPDGHYLAAGNDTVAVLKVGTGEPAFFLPGYRVGTAVVAWSPDAKLLATAGKDHLISLWEAGSWRKLAVLKGHQARIWRLAFSPDGRTLASSAFRLGDGTLRLWDVAGRRERAVARPQTSTVRNLAFTPDGQSLIAAGYGDIMNVDPLTGQERWRIRESGYSLSLSPDGRWIAVAGKPGTFSLRLVELASKRIKWTTRAHNDEIWTVTFSPDGKTIATASWDGTARLWSATTGQEIFRYDIPGVAWDVAFSPNGRYWTVGSGSASRGEVTLFEAATDAEINAPPGSHPATLQPELEPDKSEVWRQRAEVLADRGDAAGALGVYERAVRQHPTNSACWYARGEWLEKNERSDEAAVALNKALELAAADTNTLVLSQLAHSFGHLGNVLRDQGKVPHAESALRQALVLAIARWGEEDPETIAIRGDLAQLYFDLGRYHQAEPLYLKALELSPESRRAAGNPPLKEALERLGKLYAVTGRPEKGTEMQAAVTQSYRQEAERLRQAAKGDDLGALNKLARLLATCNAAAIRDGSAAIALAEKTVAATDRKDPVFLDTLAAAYAEAGRFDKAIAAEKEAMALMLDETIKQKYASRLKLYEATTPYRERE